MSVIDWQTGEIQIVKGAVATVFSELKRPAIQNLSLSVKNPVSVRLVSQHLSLIFITRRKGSPIREALDRTWRKLLLLLNLSFVAGVSSSGRYAFKIRNPLKRSLVDEVYLRICRFDA